MKHERRIVGHVSGWQEQMNTCVCGKVWPCIEAFGSQYETVDRIRRSHRSARPNPAENPAWANCHMDCGILLQRIEELEKVNAQLLEELHHHFGCDAECEKRHQKKGP